MSHHFTEQQLDDIETEFSKGIGPDVAAHRLSIPRPYAELMRILQDRMDPPQFNLAIKRLGDASSEDRALGPDDTNFCVEKAFGLLRRVETEVTNGFSDFSTDELDRLEGEIESLQVKITTLRNA